MHEQLVLFEADNAIEIIGTRHGEKKAETLLTREEYAQCEDMGDYFREDPLPLNLVLFEP
jgi:UDP-N-acetylglucosamine 4,6-dehydratase